MYAIYGNIYHQYTPNVSIYTIYMDPMGYGALHRFLVLFFETATREPVLSNKGLQAVASGMRNAKWLTP